jgi:hypothetical protein
MAQARGAEGIGSRPEVDQVMAVGHEKEGGQAEALRTVAAGILCLQDVDESLTCVRVGLERMVRARQSTT